MEKTYVETSDWIQVNIMKQNNYCNGTENSRYDIQTEKNQKFKKVIQLEQLQQEMKSLID